MRSPIPTQTRRVRGERTARVVQALLAATLAIGCTNGPCAPGACDSQRRIGFVVDHFECERCPPEAAAAPVSPPARRPKVFVVGYQTDHACLAHSTRTGIDEAVAYMKAHPETRATVHGHTDSTGSAARNRHLGHRRALVVSRYMTSRGIAPSRLSVQGHGPDDPLGDNATATGRALNRRVEIAIE